MKKEKLFKIGVVNKSTVDVVKDTTTFYTSDTELWLGFELVEVEYSYDNAEILLLNEDDHSFVVRPITQDQDGYWYEIEADITAHYGPWKGQLQLSKDGEVYTSKSFNFRIENDLSNDRPPQLVDVNNWTRLKQSANELIVDMRQAITEADKSESSRVEAEQERATAESNRKSAELLRIENEQQRKTDHANRSAELTRKADKVVIRNLIENGDFSSDIIPQIFSAGWYPSNNAIVEDYDRRSLKLMKHASGDTRAFIGRNDLKPNHMYLLEGLTYSLSTDGGNIWLSKSSNGASTGELVERKAGEWVKFNFITKANSTGIVMIGGNILEGNPLYFDDVQLIDLTETFGAGNEPTKEEMDELIKVTGYIDGEYALNNKDMLGHLMKGIREKANKKQEDWITVPLFNGAQHGRSPLKVMKDEMGFVHFKGSLTNLVTGSKVFGLPIGYGPDIGATEANIRLAVALSSGRETNVVQINYVGDGYVINPFDTTVAFFDGVSYLAKRG